MKWREVGGKCGEEREEEKERAERKWPVLQDEAATKKKKGNRNSDNRLNNRIFFNIFVSFSSKFRHNSKKRKGTEYELCRK